MGATAVGNIGGATGDATGGATAGVTGGATVGATGVGGAYLATGVVLEVAAAGACN